MHQASYQRVKHAGYVYVLGLGDRHMQKPLSHSQELIEAGKQSLPPQKNPTQTTFQVLLCLCN